MLLQKAINLIIEKDSTFRTRIALSGGEPVQYHVPSEEEVFPFSTFRLRRGGHSALGNRHYGRGMPLYDSPFIQVHPV
jgi:hypothetical protein